MRVCVGVCGCVRGDVAVCVGVWLCAWRCGCVHGGLAVCMGGWLCAWEVGCVHGGLAVCMEVWPRESIACCVLCAELTSPVAVLLHLQQLSPSVCCAARAGLRGRVRCTSSTPPATPWTRAPCAARGTAARWGAGGNHVGRALPVDRLSSHRESVSREPQILALDCLSSSPTSHPMSCVSPPTHNLPSSPLQPLSLPYLPFSLMQPSFSWRTLWVVCSSSPQLSGC